MLASPLLATGWLATSKECRAIEVSEPDLIRIFRSWEPAAVFVGVQVSSPDFVSFRPSGPLSSSYSDPAGPVNFKVNALPAGILAGNPSGFVTESAGFSFDGDAAATSDIGGILNDCVCADQTVPLE